MPSIEELEISAIKIEENHFFKSASVVKNRSPQKKLQVIFSPEQEIPCRDCNEPKSFMFENIIITFCIETKGMKLV